VAALKTEHKQFIIKELARFRPHAEIKRLLHDYFEVGVTLQQVYNFDPTKAANANRIAKPLRDLFTEARKAFIEQPSGHEASYLGYRIGRLQRMSEHAEAKGNYPLAADLLEQIAKDAGGALTNKREVKVEDKRKTLAQMLGLGSDEELPASNESIH
jgi:hypothetical protein